MPISIFIFICGGFCLCCMDALAKLALNETNLLTLVWARYIGQIIFSVPMAYKYTGRHFWKTEKLSIQLLRSTLLASTSLLFFGGVKWLPLAEASSIAFTAPIWVAILSGPILGDRVTKKEWMMACLGFSGILLIARPGTEIFHPAALLIAAMAIINALFQLLTRKLTSDPAYTTLFYSGVMGAVVCTLLLPFFGEMPGLSWVNISSLIGVGLLGGMGHLLFVKAFYRIQPSKLTPFVYLQMIWAIGLGYLMFGQLPDLTALLGMLIIVACGLWLIMHHRASHVASQAANQAANLEVKS
jgi:drug/metabolite transporter (DMT)-like permease